MHKMKTDYINSFKVAAIFINDHSPSFVKSLCFSRCGQYLVSSHTNATIDIYDIDSGTRTDSRHWTKKYGHGIVRFPSTVTNKVLLTSSQVDHNVRLLDFDKKEYHSVFEGHKEEVLSLESSATDTFVTSGKDGMVRLYDLRSQIVRDTLDQLNHPIVAMDTSGNTLVVGQDAASILHLYDVRMLHQGPFNEFRAPSGFRGTWTSVKYSANAKYLAVATDDNIVHLVDVIHSNFHTFRSRDNANKVPMDVDFSSDEKYLISGGGNGQIIAWSMESKQIAAQLSCGQDCYTSVIYNPHYDIFASASGAIKIWAPKAQTTDSDSEHN